MKSTASPDAFLSGPRQVSEFARGLKCSRHPPSCSFGNGLITRAPRDTRSQRPFISTRQRIDPMGERMRAVTDQTQGETT